MSYTARSSSLLALRGHIESGRWSGSRPGECPNRQPMYTLRFVENRPCCRTLGGYLNCLSKASWLALPPHFLKNPSPNSSTKMSKDSTTVIDISSSSDEEDDVPLMHVLRTQMKKSINTPMKDENKKTRSQYQNYDADCVVLDFNPFESIDLSTKLSLNSKDKDVDDVAVISEKGEVACRDFPHSRHVCVNFPFDFTPHLSHCEQCYCYVCDSVAPCKFWNDASGGHCHAKKDFGWDAMRQAARPTPTQ